MSKDIPIGILTRNRAIYLDATIKSLIDSDAPSFTVYDDASDDEITRKFLDTPDIIPVEHSWPKFEEWEKLGLGHLKDNDLINGIGGRIDVVKVNIDPVGVTNASCQTICDLFDINPNSPAVILLQDDIVVEKDWYQRLTSQLTYGSRLGIVAGMHLDYAKDPTYYTAQCYMITREFFERERVWFENYHSNPVSFDGQICRMANSVGYIVELIHPYVCQHIGVVSAVRPQQKFKNGNILRAGTCGGKKKTVSKLKPAGSAGNVISRLVALEKEAAKIRSLIGVDGVDVFNICEECESYRKCAGRCQKIGKPVSKMNSCPINKWVRKERKNNG